jgi:hypothetical protein
MTDLATVSVDDANISLADLEEWVNQQEAALASCLFAIGNNGTSTVATLDMDKDKPSKRVVLRPTVGGVAVQLPNLSFICKGVAFVTGQRQELAAFRS